MPPRKDSVGKSSTTSSEFIEDMNFEGNPDDNHKYTQKFKIMKEEWDKNNKRSIESLMVTYGEKLNEKKIP